MAATRAARLANTPKSHFQYSYTKSIDPNSAILLDIATKCGFVGDAGAQDINVNYDLTLSLKIAGITISPTFRSSTSFACEFAVRPQGLPCVVFFWKLLLMS